MRTLPAVLLGLLAAIAPAAAAKAPVAEVKFKVLLKVDKSPCVMRTPATVSVDAAGVPRLRLASILLDCDLDGVPATLTVRADPAENGTDVATINF